MKHIQLMRPYIPPGTAEAVTDVIGTRWIGQGPRVNEFERRFSEHVGRPCVATSSCTAALHLAYLLAGIKPGDEVVAPLFSCTATNIPLLHCGAKIRFYDVAPGSLNGSNQTILEKVTYNTRAIVVVHYGGQVVSLVNRVIGKCYCLLPIIEDCAQALGSRYAGVFGDYACYSFQAVKHITTCDGGMLTLPERQVAEAKRRRWFGIDRESKLNGTWENDVSEIGYKYQMTDISAAMGLVGLDYLDAQIAYRRELRDLYVMGLDGIDGIRVLDHDPDSACWLCTVLVERREEFKRMLAAHGIESDQVHYRNDRYSIFKDFRGEYPNMDAVDGRYLCLPLHMGMKPEDVQYVCDTVRRGW